MQCAFSPTPRAAQAVGIHNGVKKSSMHVLVNPASTRRVQASARGGRYRQTAYRDDDGEWGPSPPPQSPQGQQQDVGGIFGMLQTAWVWACNTVDGLVYSFTDIFMGSPLAPMQSESTRTAVETSIRGCLALVGLALLKGVLSLVLALGAAVLLVYVATQVFGVRVPQPGAPPSGQRGHPYTTWNGEDLRGPDGRWWPEDQQYPAGGPYPGTGTGTGTGPRRPMPDGYDAGSTSSGGQWDESRPGPRHRDMDPRQWAGGRGAWGSPAGSRQAGSRPSASPRPGPVPPGTRPPQGGRTWRPGMGPKQGGDIIDVFYDPI